MASLGQLVIELAANTARLQSDMGKAVGIVETGARKMSSAFKMLGVAGGGGVLAAVLGASVKQAIRLGDELQKASIKSGIGGRAISELAYAAKLADVDLSALSTSIKKMQISLSEASTGAKGPILALQALGLTLEQLQKRKPDEQFALIGDRISQLKDPADRARAAVELFGKAGADLLPLFEQGAAGIAKARAEAQKLGLAFSDDQLQKLSQADDSIKRLSASWEGFWVVLSAKVAPALSGILDTLSGIDSRSIDGQIAGIQEELASPSAQRVLNMNGGERRRQLEQELERLRLIQQRGLETGSSGGPTGRTAGDRGSVIGFAAAQAAQEEAKKQGEFVGITADQYQDLYDDIGRMRDDALDEDQERELKRLEFYKEAEKERQELAEKTAEFRRQQEETLTENAQLLKDTLMQGWDDWVHGGELSARKLGTYIVAELGKRTLSKLLDAWLGGAGAAGGGGGRFLQMLGGLFGGGSSGGGGGSLFGALGGLFGGGGGMINGIGGPVRIPGRARGGPVSAGNFYTVGEDGPELLLAGSSGHVFPNGAGAGTTFAPVYNIDARGATADFARALPQILRDNNRALEQTIVERLKNRFYPGLR